MKAKELREKKREELEAIEGQFRKELSEIRVKQNLGSLGNSARLSELRREIARALTVLKEKSR